MESIEGALTPAPAGVVAKEVIKPPTEPSESTDVSSVEGEEADARPPLVGTDPASALPMEETVEAGGDAPEDKLERLAEMLSHRITDRVNTQLEQINANVNEALEQMQLSMKRSEEELHERAIDGIGEAIVAASEAASGSTLQLYRHTEAELSAAMAKTAKVYTTTAVEASCQALFHRLDKMHESMSDASARLKSLVPISIPSVASPQISQEAATRALARSRLKLDANSIPPKLYAPSEGEAAPPAA
jgi:hypothetical protein